MIVTVTLNPALDKTARLDAVRVNALNRLSDVTLDAGGKGINVSALIKTLGGDSVATGFSGGKSGDELLSMLDAKGIRHDFVRIKSPTRTNLKIITGEGALTEFNEPGPEVSSAEWLALEKKLFPYANGETFFVLSGSPCRGLGPDTYQKLCVRLRAKNARVFLDADGDALKLALAADGKEEMPTCIKPNRYELLALYGIEDDPGITDAALLDLVRPLLEKGLRLCAVSLGEDGALFAGREGAWRAPALKVPVLSTVGAGDSMAGALVFALQKGRAIEECLALSVAAGAAACTMRGTNPPDRALVEMLVKEVRLKKIR